MSQNVAFDQGVVGEARLVDKGEQGLHPNMNIYGHV
jgi:hypothetical protein